MLHAALEALPPKEAPPRVMADGEDDSQTSSSEPTKTVAASSVTIVVEAVVEQPLPPSVTVTE